MHVHGSEPRPTESQVWKCSPTICVLTGLSVESHECESLITLYANDTNGYLFERNTFVFMCKVQKLWEALLFNHCKGQIIDWVIGLSLGLKAKPETRIKMQVVWEAGIGKHRGHCQQQQNSALLGPLRWVQLDFKTHLQICSWGRTTPAKPQTSVSAGTLCLTCVRE